MSATSYASRAQSARRCSPPPSGAVAPPSPFEVHWKQPNVTTDGPWPDITHSCIAADSGFADPGVRLRDFVAKFGDNGHVFSVCEANYGPPLNEIAQKIAAAMGLAIVPGADGGIDATTM